MGPPPAPRLADEYDAAQDRGEVKSKPGPIASEAEAIPGIRNLGPTHKDIHEACVIRSYEGDADRRLGRLPTSTVAGFSSTPTRGIAAKLLPLALRPTPARPIRPGPRRSELL